MVGIGVISFICHICNASEFLLIDFRKAVAQALCRSTVKTESKSCRLFPCIGCGTESPHQLESKLLSFLRRLTLSCHQLRHFVKSDIT